MTRADASEMPEIDKKTSHLIQRLPNALVDLIAAGEVIDSVGAVVRELVENALDAGADRLIIQLEPEQWQVTVIDNGRGMTEEDLKLCARPHTTSKLRGQNLSQIQSLGFRGEALHSLTQVAHLEIISRAAHQPHGWRVLYDAQGEATTLELAAIAVGTVIQVSQLFAALPQRRQALSSLRDPLKSILRYIQSLALCHPNVTWQVWQRGQLKIKLSPGETALQILPQCLKNIKLSDLYYSRTELATDSEQVAQLTLLLGLPDRCHRHRPDWLQVAVNGRPIHCPELENTILTAFHRTLPRNRFPLCLVQLQLPPSLVDWNRHPAKTEVYLQSLGFWQEQVRQAIAQGLGLNTSATEPQHRLNQLLRVSENSLSYRVNPLEQSLEAAITPLTLTAIAQVHHTYIVAEHSAGIWLVEQHIAHERVLYETIQKKWESIPLAQPLLLQQLSAAQVEQLQRLGLEIDPFGEDCWAIRNLPTLLHQRPDQAEAVWEMSLGGDLATAQAAIACRTAIKNGTPLSLPEMQTLLNQWAGTRHPQTCPHGRPIYLALNETSLARFFRRNWLIGH